MIVKLTSGIAFGALCAVLLSLFLPVADAAAPPRSYTLRLSDLPKGYVLLDSKAQSAKDEASKKVSAAAIIRHGFLSGYETAFATGKTSKVQKFVVSFAAIFRASGGAAWFEQAEFADAGAQHAHRVKVPHIGDASRGYTRNYSQNGAKYTDYVVSVRRGSVFVGVDTTGAPGTVHIGDAVALARIVAGRIG